MQFDLSDETISEAPVAASRVTGNETGEVVWDVEDHALTPGLVFYGVTLKGRFVGTGSGESPLDGSIGGFWQL